MSKTFFQRVRGILLWKLDSKAPEKVPDIAYLKIKYFLRTGKFLHINNPKTFNEKLQWLKQYGRKPSDVILSDKYAVKKYISNLVGEQYVIPLLGVWDHFDDIDFDSLPNQFVLKCSHDSGGIVICKNKSKLNLKEAKRKLEKSLLTDYYVYSREKAYKDMPRRIIAEQYMEDSRTKELRDYKFFCFGGVVKYFKIDFDRFTEHRANYYDRDCNLQTFGETICPPDFQRQIQIPNTISEMIKLAEKLSVGFPFIRVDLYDIDGRIYFGEYTFSPACGMGVFTDDSVDKEWGDLMRLPNT